LFFAFHATSTASAALMEPMITAPRKDVSQELAGSRAAATPPSTTASTVSALSTAVTARTRLMVSSVDLASLPRISAGTQLIPS
jgi:hypothetical protein